MAFLVTFHWGWLLASALLGLAMGWIAVVQRGQGVSKQLARWLAVLAAALVAAALAQVIPGRPGYWLDLGLLMFATYFRGCATGCSRATHRVRYDKMPLRSLAGAVRAPTGRAARRSPERQWNRIGAICRSPARPAVRIHEIVTLGCAGVRAFPLCPAARGAAN